MTHHDKLKQVKDSNTQFNVYIHDWDTTKIELIDLHNSKDRRKLDYILKYQGHQIRKDDLKKYETRLKNYKK